MIATGDKHRLIGEALKIAGRSTHRKHMTGCVIVSGDGKVISNGWSHSGTWRLRELYSMHAEIHAILRARHLDLTGSTIYVATVARKSGATTEGRPCVTCAAALATVGIKTAYSTTRSENGAMWFALQATDMERDLNDLKVYRKPPR